MRLLLVSSLEKKEFSYVYVAFTKSCKYIFYKVTLNKQTKKTEKTTTKAFFMKLRKYAHQELGKKDFEGLTVGESIFLSILISYNMPDYPHIQKTVS